VSNLQPIQQPSSLQWPPLQQPQLIVKNWRTPQFNKDFDHPIPNMAIWGEEIRMGNIEFVGDVEI